MLCKKNSWRVASKELLLSCKKRGGRGIVALLSLVKQSTNQKEKRDSLTCLGTFRVIRRRKVWFDPKGPRGKRNNLDPANLGTRGNLRKNEPQEPAW